MLACTGPVPLRTPFGTTALGVECHDGAVADESDDRAGERDVLTNLPRTRPARRSARRAAAPPEAAAPPAPAKKAPAKRAPAAKKPAPAKAPTRAAAAKPRRSPAKPAAARRPAAKPAEPEVVVVPTRAAPPLPPAREPHRSPMADLAVTSIELSGALFHMGISITRSVLRATVGRVPRP
jgi:hypothetical protein